jgi:predicted O-methyltransferase YrrM
LAPPRPAIVPPVVPLPKVIRAHVPDRVRHDRRLRGVALAAGLIPPRKMHSAAEAALLARLASRARRVVEIGVYEGSSALVLCAALPANAELHLIDPFVDESGWALPPGWRPTQFATRLVVRRGAASGGPNLRWHIARSQDVGRTWAGGPVDLVFIDGDHRAEACQEDWELWSPHVPAGGRVAFHDAREGKPHGHGGPGPTAVVDRLFRGPQALRQWRVDEELETMVVVQRLAG